MKCPACLAQDTKVNDSRLSEDGFAIKRRRECQKCSFRFSTYEQMEILNLLVVKRNGVKEPYSRDKLESGLKKSLEKRPYTLEDFKKLVSTVERDIQKRKQDEITSAAIGEIVMKRLKFFDKVAYIRFASVYRAFEDVKTFQHELNSLLKPALLKKTVKSLRIIKKK
ncbi:MAG: transcriptional regulator NrdR [Candidatus Komeilibacteria bacterium]|nr:transcriptional regulator NrdR [Candidatus Komeilibacteria bacterium]